MRALVLVFAAVATGCTSFAGVDLAQPLDKSKQRCIECALRVHTDPANLPRALARFREGCDAGDAQSCSVLGVMYETGSGVPRDEARARELYAFACRKGNARACSSLGALVEKDGDLDGAATLYEVACFGAQPEACQSLGALHQRRGDAADARAAFARGCKNRHPESCESLGVMLLTTSPARARKLLDRACQAGRTEACDRLDGRTVAHADVYE
jgi:uncharacterized protein